MPVVISNGLREAAPTTTVSCMSTLHAYSYIQQSGRSVKTMNAKNTKKSTIHKNADANITCDLVMVTSAVLGVGCHTHTATHIVSSIIVRCIHWSGPSGMLLLCILLK